jgi:hypothetical protein
MTYIVRAWDLNPTCRYKFSVWLFISNRSVVSLLEKLKLVAWSFANCIAHDSDLQNVYLTEEQWEFNVHGSVHRNNILIYIQQDATLHSLFYLESALHVSGGTSTHHQRSTNNCIYSIWYLSHRYYYLLLSWKSWNWFEHAVGGIRTVCVCSS